MSPERNSTGRGAEEFVKEAFEAEIPEELEARMDAQFAAFRRDLRSRRTRAFRWKAHVLRLAGAMTCALVVIAVIQNFVSSGMPPTWAEVGARFASVPFFGATVYVKPGPTSEPVQFDLWMNQEGLLRMRAGNQVMFGKGGLVTDTVTLPGPDTASHAKVYGREILESITKSLAGSGGLTFDSFVRALPGKTIVSTPSYNQEASIARNLAVYDIVNPEGAEWTRIWALQESKLPVHVLYWSPEDGYSVDAVLTYSNQQDTEFFDPQRFRESLKEHGEGAGEAYLLLKDPGGRPVTPSDVKKTP